MRAKTVGQNQTNLGFAMSRHFQNSHNNAPDLKKR